MDPLEVFAANLRRIREERGMTKVALAERSGIDLTSVGRIERGERDPGVRTIAALAAGLGARPIDLVSEVPARVRPRA